MSRPFKVTPSLAQQTLTKVDSTVRESGTAVPLSPYVRVGSSTVRPSVDARRDVEVHVEIVEHTAISLLAAPCRLSFGQGDY